MGSQCFFMEFQISKSEINNAYGSSDPRLITRTVYELLSIFTNLTATETYFSRLAGTKPVKRLADL